MKILALLILSALSLCAQGASEQSAPAAIATKIALHSGSTPYHATWTYTAYGFAKGRKVTGKFEIVYVEPTLWREYITNDAGFSEILIRNGAATYRKSNFPIRLLREQQLMSPFSGVKPFGIEKRIDRKISGVHADCDEISGGNLPTRTYCFNPGSGELLSMTDASGHRYDFSSWRQVGDRLLPEEWRLTERGKLALEAHLSDADPQADTSSTLFLPPVGATQRSAPPACTIGVQAGRKLGGDPPKYPLLAKLDHEGGQVILGATINKEGHIANLSVLQSSGPELDRSATDAVRTWTYEPYTACGQPVEVDTLITINYNISVR